MLKKTADMEKRYIPKVWCGGVPVCLRYHMRGSLWGPKLFYYAINGRPLNIQLQTYISDTDLRFVKKFTRPDFRAKILHTKRNGVNADIWVDFL